MATVILSIAHTVKAQGASAGNIAEHPFSRAVVSHAQRAIEAAGHKVVVISGPIPKKLAAAAEVEDAACLVEPHLNAAARAYPRGHLVIRDYRSEPGKKLAEHIETALETGYKAAGFATKRLGFVDVPSRFVAHSSLPMVQDTKPPAVITEGAFLTNPEDLAFLEREDAPEVMGNAIAAGVLAFLTP
jgi:N-acetylmuramoyl-L-alanine amidase